MNCQGNFHQKERFLREICTVVRRLFLELKEDVFIDPVSQKAVGGSNRVKDRKAC
jgi:hypothetical protein